MMKLYRIRTAIAAWVLNTNAESIRSHLAHFTYRKYPDQIPMMCPTCGKEIPPGEEAWTGSPESNIRSATCVGCADA